MSTAQIVATTAAALAQLPDDQLAGPSPLTDALDTLTDEELVTTAQAVAITAKNAPDAATQAKAVRVLKAAQVVGQGRQKAKDSLAAARPFPATFAASKAGAAMSAVAARRDRLGQPGGSGAGVTKRPMGPLTYYNLWVAQGKWGRQPAGGTDSTLAHFGLVNHHKAAPAAAFDARPRDAIEAKALGYSDPLAAQGLRGLGALAGLNLGKFFSNLVKDVAPYAGLASALIPGVGTVASGILTAVGNAAGGQAPQSMAAPVYGPAPLPPVQAPKPSGAPAWLWPAVAAGGLLLLAGSRK